MTTRKTFTTVPDALTIYDSAIAYTKMLMVSREGMTMDVVVSNDDITITNRQALFQPGLGTIVFNNTFNPNETINVIYETNP